MSEAPRPKPKPEAASPKLRNGFEGLNIDTNESRPSLGRGCGLGFRVLVFQVGLGYRGSGFRALCRLQDRFPHALL